MKVSLNIVRLVSCLAVVAISPRAHAQLTGCTDPLATNYNASATVNDGSCIYAPTSVTPYAVKTLSDTVMETSGLVWYNSNIWTHNDNTDLNLYALDTTSGQIANKVAVQNTANIDWEELTQDSAYFYIGDFGNNVNGNRTDLRILRIAKVDLPNGIVNPDTIRFSYFDQTDFSATGNNNTDFDCEALIATDDSLYLFTKQWLSNKTSVYSLSKTPSSTPQTAQLLYSYDVQGLVTGATYVRDKKSIVLCGYATNSSTFLNPFVFLLYDFHGNNFFGGNKRKITIVQPFSQIEGITTADGKSFFVSNEKLTNSIITIPARLEKIDLTQYLSGYYQSLKADEILFEKSLTVFPNPAAQQIAIALTSKLNAELEITLYDAKGTLLVRQHEKALAGTNRYNVNPGNRPSGSYYLQISSGKQTLAKKIEIRD